MGNCFLFELRTCKPLCILRLRRVCRAQGISSKVLESPSLLPDVEVSEVEVIAVRGEGRLWLWQALRRIGRVTILPPPTHTHRIYIVVIGFATSLVSLHPFHFTLPLFCLCFASRISPSLSSSTTRFDQKHSHCVQDAATSVELCQLSLDLRQPSLCFDCLGTDWRTQRQL